MKRPLIAFYLSLLLAAVAHAAPPANDDFANAQTLTGTSGHIVLYTTEATDESGDYSPGEKTVWFRVSVPAGKTVVIDTFGSDFDTVIEAGRAGSASVLYSYDRNDDTPDTVQSRILLHSLLDISEVFHVRVRGKSSGSGELHLNHLLVDVPILGFGTASFIGHDSQFSAREGSVAEVAVSRRGRANVAVSVQVVLQDESATAGHDYLGSPVTLHFASGETSKTVHVPIYADGVSEGPETLRVRLVNPTGYAILGETGEGTLLIDDAQDDPANDDASGAEVLSGFQGTIAGDTTGAGSVSGECPFRLGSLGGPQYHWNDPPNTVRTVWYRWTPAASGEAELQVTGLATGGQPFLLGVWEREPPSAFGYILSSYGSSRVNPWAEPLHFYADAGRTYWIMVTADESDGGPFTLNYKLHRAPGFQLAQRQGAREDAGAMTVTVRRIGDADGIATVDYTTLAPVVPDLMGGLYPKADPLADYTPVSGTLTFADGVTEQTFTIDLTADTLPEGHEFISVQLRFDSLTGIRTAEAFVVIDEEEDDPANDLFANAQAITGATGSVGGDTKGAGTEAGEPAGFDNSVWYSWVVPTDGFARFRVGVSDWPTQSLTVYRGASLATLARVASASSFPTFSIFSLPDVVTATREGQLSVTAGDTLWIAVSASRIGAPFTFGWELSSGSRFHLSADEYTVHEAEGFATVRIERDGPTTQAASIGFETSDFIFRSPRPRFPLNALPGSDYQTTSLNVLFAPGQAFRDIQIPVYRDQYNEDAEVVRLRLVEPSVGSVIVGLYSGRLIILNSPAYTPRKAAFTGLISSPTGALGESGSFTANTDAKSMLTGKLFLGGKFYGFKGSIAADGSVLISIPRRGKPAPAPLTLTLQLGADFDTLAGTLIVDGTTLGVSAHPSVFTRANPAILAGRYSAILESGGNSSAPDAPGFALLSIAPATGAVKIAGALADGTKFTCGTFLAPDGTIPVSILLYKSTGILHGELRLGDYTPEQDGSGSLRWVHPLQAKGQFSSTFATDLPVRISAYTYTAGVSALPLPDPGDGFIDLTGDVSLNKHIGISDKSAITVITPSTNAEKVTVKIATATGLLTGSFRHTDGKVVPFSGVLYQRTVEGHGFFLGPTVNGSVRIAE